MEKLRFKGGERKLPENLDDIYSKDRQQNFNKLSEIFRKKLPENFEENLNKTFQNKLNEVKNILNRLYEENYDNDLGLIPEGHSLELHTSMVINQFAKYYNQFRGELSDKIDTETFVLSLILHDFGKVDSEVQEAKKTEEREVWKKKETLKTVERGREILKNISAFDEEQKKIIIFLLEHGNMDDLLFNKVSFEEYANKIIKYSDNLGLSPLETFKLIEVFHTCDASAYSLDAIKNYEEDMGDKYKETKEAYEESRAGATEWFNTDYKGQIFFQNHDMYGGQKIGNWIKEVKNILEKID